MKCAHCEDETHRIAKLGQEWLCRGCHRAVACDTCGGMAHAVGIERYALPDSEQYALDQCMHYRCEGGHVTHGEIHKGPGK